MESAFQVALNPIYRGVKPVRDPKYLAFLRTFPCVVCCGTRWIEAAHFGAHGTSQKASDLDALPLCRAHHQTGKHARHKIGPVRFAAMHCLDVPALQEMFQAFWNTKKKSELRQESNMKLLLLTVVFAAFWAALSGWTL